MGERHEAGRTDWWGVETHELIVIAGIAVAGGIAIHLGLHVARLHWTWGLALTLLAAPLALIDGAGAAMWFSSTAIATATSREWHQRDLERGGTEAQRTRERIGVAAALARLVARRGGDRPRRRGERLVIGRNRQGRPATVPFGATQGRRGLILGAPGSGKTVSMAALAHAYVNAGLPVFCLDPKGDRSLRDSLAEAAAGVGKELREWSHEGPAVYNPLARGGPTEVADKVLAGEHWSEPHYLRQAQRYVGHVMRVMQVAGETRSLSTLVRLMNPDALDALGERCDAETRDALAAYLDSLSARQASELGGVRDRIAVLAESELGPYLDPSRPGERVDLWASWREGAVLYFRLDADRFPLASEMLAAAIVSDLVSLTGELQRGGAKGLVAVDEFAAVNSNGILRVLSRSRSAGISVLVATQGLADLGEIRSEGGADAVTRRVLSQVDFVVAHRQPEPQSADVLAAMAGTRPTWITTRRVDSRWAVMPKQATGTRSREREYVRHPDEFKRLAIGEAIVIEPAAATPAEVVRVWPATNERHGRFRPGGSAS